MIWIREKTVKGVWERRKFICHYELLYRLYFRHGILHFAFKLTSVSSPYHKLMAIRSQHVLQCMYRVPGGGWSGIEATLPPGILLSFHSVSLLRNEDTPVEIRRNGGTGRKCSVERFAFTWSDSLPRFPLPSFISQKH